MVKMLIINAHPQINSKTSISLEVYDYFIKVYKSLNPTGSIEQINLYSDDVPPVDKVVLDAQQKLIEKKEWSEEQKRIMARRSEILQQFKSANTYVIVMPLHNFNIPSKLKDYMDAIIVPRETYKFTEAGSVGLLNDGRRILVIQGSGSIYTNNDWYNEVEYSHKYLKSMFEFLGVKEYQIIRAQGISLLDREEIRKKAFQEAEEAAFRLASPVTVA
jgi:FMN-dependent NADH-azoreductase